MKKITTLVLAAIMCLSLVACKTQNTESGLVDRAGNAFVLPQKVERVISLAPGITQTIAGLDAQAKLVGIDTNSIAIVGESNVAVIGSEPKDGQIAAFDMLAPSAEQIVALQPDIVFISGMSMVAGVDPLAQLKDQGICVVYIPTAESFDDIKKDITFIADCLGEKAKGEAMVKTFDEELNVIKTLSAKIEDKKSVYFEVSAAPYMYSTGAGTFLHEMIEAVGGVNIFAGETGWMSVSGEAIVSANPQVIFTNDIFSETPIENIMATPAYAGLDAIKNAQVFGIDPDESAQPTYRITRAMWQMGQLMYPDVFLADTIKLTA